MFSPRLTLDFAKRLLLWMALGGGILCGTPQDSPAAEGGTTDFAVGAAKVDISPAHPVRLTGYGYRTEEATRTAHPITARAVVIEQLGEPVERDAALPAAAGGRATIFVSLDTCGYAAKFADDIAAQLKALYGVPRENVAICASHTHTAPWLLHFAPNILPLPLPAEHEERCRQYESFLVGKTLEVVEAAMQSRRPARLYRGEGKAGFASNRRGARPDPARPGEPPQVGPADHRLPVLIARDLEDRPVAILSNYACHCTTLGSTFNEVAGDWVGYAHELVDEAFPGAVSVTVIGCGADANPDPRGELEECRRHGKEIADEVQRVLSGELTPVRSPLACRFEYVDLPLAPASREQFEEQATRPHHVGVYGRHFLELLDRGETLPTTVSLPVGVWAFGDDLALVFLGGEVVVDYSILLGERIDPSRLWITAYANAVPCYIPSQRILREGGYEPDASMIYYRQPGRFAPEVEPTLLGAVQRLVPPVFYHESLQSEYPPPLRPEASLATMRTRPGLRVELVASEPLICDPVAFDWGVDGKLWVIEMFDYPNGLASDPYRQHQLDAREGPDATSRPGGRVKFLEDTNGDGEYDRATVFLDGLPFPTGIHCWREGVLITAAPEVLYAEDTTGDGQADVVRTLFRGFGEGNQQHRVNGLRWGLDNWMYLGNGDSGGEIEAVDAVSGMIPSSYAPPWVSGLGERVDVSGRDLRIRPDECWMQAVSGQTQFGREPDDWGNWFGNNNSRPMFHYTLDDVYLRRNPYLAVRDTRSEVPEIRGAGPVYPISRTLARFNMEHSANHFTSACSTIVYRDHWLGEEYAGNSFTCEPVHNLISRAVLRTQGATFKSRRADDEQDSEFLASTDNWFRPVMIRTAPDGSLWVADMYRYIIEHPRWIPDDWKARLDLRAGDDRGRIYRIVPETPVAAERGHPLAVLPSAAASLPEPVAALPTARLIAALDSANGWQRDTAQRLLVHRRDLEGLEGLRTLAASAGRPLARLHAYYTLSAMRGLSSDLILGAMTDEHPGLRRHGTALSFRYLRHPQVLMALLDRARDDDPFVRVQAAYALGYLDLNSQPEFAQDVADALAHLAADKDPTLRLAALSSLTSNNADAVLLAAIDQHPQDHALLVELTRQTAWLVDPAHLPSLALQLLTDPANADWRLTAATQLLDVLRRRQIDWRTLRTPAGARLPLETLLDEARILAADAQARWQRRSEAISLLVSAEGDSEQTVAFLVELLNPRESTDLQTRIVDALTQAAPPDMATSLLGCWPRATPTVRARIVDRLLQKPETAMRLLDALESGVLLPADLGRPESDRLLSHPDEALRLRASQLLSTATASSRAEALAAFQPAVERAGDPLRGQAVFSKRCAACHQLQGLGRQLGADLAAVKDRSPQALLIAILDPNRAVEARYISYSAALTDGRALSGMLVSETANSITLADAEGREYVLLRSEIEELRSSGKSFMPEGLERDLSIDDLSDLMAFVAAAAPPKPFPGNQPSPVQPNDDGSLQLAATAAAIYGPTMVFESEFENLGWWQSEGDYAVWTIPAAPAGRYTIRIEYACQDSSAGGTLQLSAGDSSALVPVVGTGAWSSYRTSTVGELQLPEGPVTIVARAHGPISRALVDLRTIELIPAGERP